MKSKIYVACRPGLPRRVFLARREPQQTDGLCIDGVGVAACIGPFRTVRGAAFMAEYGRGNPHVQCVADAERLGRLYAHTLSYKPELLIP